MAKSSTQLGEMRAELLQEQARVGLVEILVADESSDGIRKSEKRVVVVASATHVAPERKGMATKERVAFVCDTLIEAADKRLTYHEEMRPVRDRRTLASAATSNA